MEGIAMGSVWHNILIDDNACSTWRFGAATIYGKEHEMEIGFERWRCLRSGILLRTLLLERGW